MAQVSPDPVTPPPDTILPPVAPPVVSVPRRVRPRFSAQERARRKNQGLLGHLTTLLFQPRLFFHTLPDTRQWLVVAILSLGIVGYSAIQEATRADLAGSDAAGLPTDGSFSGEFGGFDPSMMPEGEMPFIEEGPTDPFAIPLPEQGGGEFVEGAAPSASTDTTSQVTTAVTAGAFLVGIWGLQALLLLVVTLFNGRAPSLGRGLQIAVWSSVPLVIMLIVQAIYHAAGGTGSAAGLSAVLPRWEFYMRQSPDVQWLLMSAFSQATLWGLWSVLLLYLGARDALRGRWLLCVGVVVLWIGIIIAVPVLLNIAPLPPAGMPS